MGPRRHPLPTPAWAELPATGAVSDDAFRGFIHGERFGRRSRSDDEQHPDALAGLQRALDDDEVPLPAVL
jgi:hypothetical protein